jgi:hypothetical protein
VRNAFGHDAISLCHAARIARDLSETAGESPRLNLRPRTRTVLADEVADLQHGAPCGLLGRSAPSNREDATTEIDINTQTSHVRAGALTGGRRER